MICTPTTGRLRLLASILLASSFGLPCASLGSLIDTMDAQSAPPQSVTRMVALPPSVSQVPVGSTAKPAIVEAPIRAIASAQAHRILVLILSSWARPIGALGYHPANGAGQWSLRPALELRSGGI